MVRNYGFENMNEFLLTFKQCKIAHIDDQQEIENWQQACDKSDIKSNKTEKLSDSLADYKGNLQKIISISISRQKTEG